MTPKVPIRERGTATRGMMVAQTLPKKAKITKTTSTMEMQRRRNRGAQQGNEGHDAVDGIDHVGARLTEDGHQDTALAVGEAQVARIFDGVDDFRDVAQAHGSALMSGND